MESLSHLSDEELEARVAEIQKRKAAERASKNRELDTMAAEYSRSGKRMETVLAKDDRELVIVFVPRTGNMSKGVYVNGRLTASNPARNMNIFKYREQVRSALRGGWSITTTEQRDMA